MKVYQKLSSLLSALNNCQNKIESHCLTIQEAINCNTCVNAQKWLEIHQENIDKIIQMFPKGSGFDCGTEFNQFLSTPEKLIFITEFHHLNEYGFYTGWTRHKITVKPSLQFDFKININGKNKNNIKNYIVECFEQILNTEV